MKSEKIIRYFLLGLFIGFLILNYPKTSFIIISAAFLSILIATNLLSLIYWVGHYIETYDDDEYYIDNLSLDLTFSSDILSTFTRYAFLFFSLPTLFVISLSYLNKKIDEKIF